MGRPRAHEPADLLAHARLLWAEKGRDGVTIRALSSRSGASNGAIYHAFGSRRSLLLQVWASTAEAFLDHQEREAEQALADLGPREAVVAAAVAPATYAALDPIGARVLLSLLDGAPDGAQDGARDETDLEPAERERLQRHRRRVGALVTGLATALWPECTTPAEHREATTLVRHCLVDLPTALLLADDRLTDPLSRRALRHAVLGLLSAFRGPSTTSDGAPPLRSTRSETG